MENISRTKLTALILGIIVLALMAAGISQLIEKTKQKAENSECKASISAYAEAQKYLTPDEKSIKCPAHKITLTGTEKNMKYQLAEEMKTCWDNYQKGQKALFKGEGTFCSICSIIRAEKDTQVNGFTKYLMTAYTQDYTYYEFLTDYYTVNSPKILEEYEAAKNRAGAEDSLTFQEGKNYAVIFLHIKGYDHFKAFWEKQKATLAPKAVQAGGAATTTTALMLFGISFLKTSGGAAMIPIPGARIAALSIASAGIAIFAIGYSWEEIEEKFIEAKKFDFYSEVLLREYTKETLKELGCTNIPIQPEEI